MSENQRNQHITFSTLKPYLFFGLVLWLILLISISLSSDRTDLKNDLADIRRHACNCADDIKTNAVDPDNTQYRWGFNPECGKISKQQLIALIKSEPSLYHGPSVIMHIQFLIRDILSFIIEDDDDSNSLVEQQIDRDYDMTVDCIVSTGVDPESLFAELAKAAN